MRVIPANWIAAIGVAALLCAAYAGERAVIAPGPGAKPGAGGQRIFTCGHSFHYFMPAILDAVAEKAGIEGHRTVGLSAIGGSPISAHWLVSDDKNEAKAALNAGKVDVLTLSPVWLPDVGIGHFARLANEHNPKVRIAIQEFWLPNDEYDPVYPLKVNKQVDRDAITIAELRKRHAPYFKAMDDEVRRLNGELSRPALAVVPVGQAVLDLREKVVQGKVSGIKKQSELFRDDVGHPRAPIQLLAAYCHYAVIYRSSPVGLPLPGRCKDDKQLFDRGLWTLTVGKPVLFGYEDDSGLNRLLQELTWEAVIHHPLSGVKPAAAASGTPAVPTRPAKAPEVVTADLSVIRPDNNPADDSVLPRVLLIGDSISIGYTVPVRNLLRGRANVHHVAGNCQDTAYSLGRIKAWVGTGRWDVIHFNWGIWDTHGLLKKTGRLMQPQDEPRYAPGEIVCRNEIDQYRTNLVKLVAVLKGTGASLIWASSTPVTLRKGDRFDDIARYNAAAAEIMRAGEIPVNDLYALTLSETANWQTDGCHFGPAGNARMGEQVAKFIGDALADADLKK